VRIAERGTEWGHRFHNGPRGVEYGIYTAE
jgi:hypothetical protein